MMVQRQSVPFRIDEHLSRNGRVDKSGAQADGSSQAGSRVTGALLDHGGWRAIGQELAVIVS
jgi:hypothetical protein